MFDASCKCSLGLGLALLIAGCGEAPAPAPSAATPPAPDAAGEARARVEAQWARLARLHPDQDPAERDSNRIHAEGIPHRLADVRFGGGLGRYIEALGDWVEAMPRAEDLDAGTRNQLVVEVRRVRHLLEDLAWLTGERRHAMDVVFGGRGGLSEYRNELDANLRQVAEVVRRRLPPLIEGGRSVPGLTLAAALASRVMTEEDVRVFTRVMEEWNPDHPFEAELADVLWWFATRTSTNPKLRAGDRRRALARLFRRAHGAPGRHGQMQMAHLLRAEVRMARHFAESLTEADDRVFTEQVEQIRALVTSGEGADLLETLRDDTHPFDPLGVKHAALKKRVAWDEGLAVIRGLVAR